MKRIFYLLLFSSLLLGCDRYEVEKSYEQSANQTVDSPKLSAIKNYLSLHHKQGSRSNPYDVIPYILGGDTVLYIVNHC